MSRAHINLPSSHDGVTTQECGKTIQNMDGSFIFTRKGKLSQMFAAAPKCLRKVERIQPKENFKTGCDSPDHFHFIKKNASYADTKTLA